MSLLVVAGCTFGGDGSASGSQGLGGTADEDTEATVTTSDGVGDDEGDDGGSTGDVPPDDSGASSSGSGADPKTGEARLVLTGTMMLDGVVGEISTFKFQLRNEGEVAATNIEPLELVDPAFVFEGGFPGENGDCESTLEAGAECVVGLQFQPVMWGVYQGVLGVSYEGGVVAEESVVIVAVGGGLTPNLVVNAGFDDSIDNWLPSPETWTTVLDSASESSVVTAGSSSMWTFTLSQDIDLAAWSESVDSGLVGAPVSVSHRAGSFANDPHSLRVTFLDDRGDPITMFDSNGGGAWNNVGWEASAEMAQVPPEARTAQITLNCLRNIAATNTCSGFFDNPSLQLQFPVDFE